MHKLYYMIDKELVYQGEFPEQFEAILAYRAYCANNGRAEEAYILQGNHPTVMVKLGGTLIVTHYTSVLPSIFVEL